MKKKSIYDLFIKDEGNTEIISYLKNDAIAVLDDYDMDTRCPKCSYKSSGVGVQEVTCEKCKHIFHTLLPADYLRLITPCA